MSMVPNLAVLGSYHNRVMVDGAVYRRVDVDDGMGGVTSTWEQVATTRVQLVEASESQRVAAQQDGYDISHVAILPIDTTLQFRDRIEVGSRMVQLQSAPSTATHASVARVPVVQDPFDEPTS